jgi:hypothetical protein
MDSISKKVNNDTIEVMNNLYKELYTLQCKRSYILKENKYDDNIEKCIGELFKSLGVMYLSIIEKETVEEMEGNMVDKMEEYDDSGIPDIQGTFDECITPRTVLEPHTPSAPVKARKKIIVEEHDLEDNDEEEDNVLNHIMNYSDDEDTSESGDDLDNDSDNDSDNYSGNESDDSYEKISDEEDDKPVFCGYKMITKKVLTGNYHKKMINVDDGYYKNGKPKTKHIRVDDLDKPLYKTIKVPEGPPIYKRVSN